MFTSGALRCGAASCGMLRRFCRIPQDATQRNASVVNERPAAVAALTVDVVAMRTEQLLERLSWDGRRHLVVKQRAQFLVQSADRHVLLRHEVTADGVQ